MCTMSTEGQELQEKHQLVPMKPPEAPRPPLTLQREVLSVPTEVEVSHRRAQMGDDALHMLAVEAAPRYIQLLHAARTRQRETGTGEMGGPEELRLRWSRRKLTESTSPACGPEQQERIQSSRSG